MALRGAPVTPLVECVPNFSEGRDPAVVDAIVEAIAAVPGVAVLAHERDPDHNRAVVTFLGPPEAVAEGALRGIGTAVERIDLSRHSGVHPRIGATDVVPFVPIEDITLAACAALAVRTAEEVWRRFRVPVYLYEAAARLPGRARLENIRRGGLDYLRAHISERPPDIGGPSLHPTAGATVIGARKLLIAFNINLTTSDIGIAKAVARAIRQSSGGLPHVKALGLPIASRGCAQVSINLTDFEVTGLHEVFEAVRIEAQRHGAAIASSEIIGLVPRIALEAAAAGFLRIANYSPDRVLERRIEQTRQR
jgi:glutamate formiminotransferase